ncbi:SIMPL domain-containing protein [uncultured Alistipes sp.]|uniref:SIMPL domain-containing protein n=1 Tax=uncultured Alistipes sp. TaxID=538949 RepID=UPI002603BBF0|nr:SIMPL domain-containing protein [uncultured Alistipes sp.]
MKAYWKYIIIGVAIIASAWLLARAYMYKYHAQETIVVTGLGETEFTSDLIVWNGYITAESSNVESGYAQIEASKKKVYDYITSKGIAPESVVFQFVNVNKQYESVYNSAGNWVGQRFTGYQLSQSFTIESNDVDAVENISREISSLIAQGVSIEARQPDYYYTKLDDVKLSLIEKASADARARAEKIAANAGAKIGRVASARMGVFQITGANTNEEFSAGGSFNTSSRQKKARITMRIEYRVK